MWDDDLVMYYLRTGSHDAKRLKRLSASESRKEVCRVERRSKAYRWDNNTAILYKRPSGKYTAECEVPAPADRSDVIQQVHDMGHFGMFEVGSMVMARWYWRGVTQHIKQKLKQCLECVRGRALFKQGVAEMKLLPSSTLWERVHVDQWVLILPPGGTRTATYLLGLMHIASI